MQNHVQDTCYKFTWLLRLNSQLTAVDKLHMQCSNCALLAHPFILRACPLPANSTSAAASFRMDLEISVFVKVRITKRDRFKSFVKIT